MVIVFVSTMPGKEANPSRRSVRLYVSIDESRMNESVLEGGGVLGSE